jgi:hypothetical protein
MRHARRLAHPVALLPVSMLLSPLLAALVEPPGLPQALSSRLTGTRRATVALTPIAGRAQLQQAAAPRAVQQTVALGGTLAHAPLLSRVPTLGLPYGR